ncbi:gliding motility-associated C-terminal domain-containing protein [Flavobacterium sp. RHBU_24]|uniref:T9SS type B sorting domain-containing protein n=1 Tax=Flavobacterium sp. RHBU_24 TaxID=3391185 RepID=UPI0039853BDA
MKRLLVISFTVLVCYVQAQRQNENWFFGEGAGINFENGIAVPFYLAPMGAIEGCATQSDANGNFLFFTDGMRVYNSEGDWMENGSDLLGDYSSAQAVIVQKPGSDTIYYIFHAASGSVQPLFTGVRYSELDMSLDGGLGDVTANKNIQILDDGTEQVAATRHRNGVDIWVLCHGMGNAYYAFLVTADGVQPPVISYAGLEVTQASAITGMHKFSPDGSKVAASLYFEGLFLYDFDNVTGIVSNAQTLDNTEDYWYGVEFSPDSSLLYAAVAEGSTHLFQYNLAAPDIPASEFMLYSTLLSGSGALQLAPDGKIYMSQGYRPKLSVINNPNGLGADCQFTFHTFDLDGRLAIGGLPPTNMFPLPLSIAAADTACKGEAVQFTSQTTIDFDSLLWDFGDGTTATAPNPEHTYTAAGTYTVTLTAFLPGVERKETLVITVTALPASGLETQYTICEGTPLVLTAPTGLTHSWSTGAQTQSIEIATAGSYSLTLSNGACSETHSFEVQVITLPPSGLESTYTLCEGTPLALTAPVGLVYSWSTGAQTQIVEIATAGSYSLTLSNGECSETHNFEVDVITLPASGLESQYTICEGVPLILTAPDGLEYAWSTGVQTQTIEIATAGSYSLTLSNAGCSETFDFEVDVITLPESGLESQYTICEGVPLILTAPDGLEYAWSTGVQTQSIEIATAGNYTLTLSNGECNETHNFEVIVTNCQEEEPIIQRGISPNGDNLNDFFDLSRNGQLNLSIYNRYGQEVYSRKNYTTEWIGQTNTGQELPTGTYYYVIQQLSGMASTGWIYINREQ